MWKAVSVWESERKTEKEVEEGVIINFKTKKKSKQCLPKVEQASDFETRTTSQQNVI